jgi:hypothetical protein
MKRMSILVLQERAREAMGKSNQQYFDAIDS